MSRLTVTKDSVAEVIAAVSGLVLKQVLIGVPESNAHRDDGQISNAALAYIHEFGSPSQNVPARPFLRPGVKKATTEAIPQLEKAVRAALDGEKSKVSRALNNGERWRAEVRAAVRGVHLERDDAGEILHLDAAQHQLAYRSASGALYRRIDTGPRVLTLEGVKSCSFQSDQRGDTTAWCWIWSCRRKSKAP